MEVLAPVDLAQCEKGAVLLPFHERQGQGLAGVRREIRGVESGAGKWNTLEHKSDSKTFKNVKNV